MLNFITKSVCDTFVIRNMYSQNYLYGIILDDIGDHLSILLVLGNVQTSRSSTHITKGVCQMTDANFNSFKTNICCADWRAVDESDASILYDCFHNK